MQQLKAEQEALELHQNNKTHARAACTHTGTPGTASEDRRFYGASRLRALRVTAAPIPASSHDGGCMHCTAASWPCLTPQPGGNTGIQRRDPPSTRTYSSRSTRPVVREQTKAGINRHYLTPKTSTVMPDIQTLSSRPSLAPPWPLSSLHASLPR